jgi:uncharacterized protein (TIRG00374 family)
LGKNGAVKRAIVGVVIGGGILVVLLLRVDLGQLGAVLWGVHMGLLAVGLAIKVAVMWLKSARWAITIRGVTGHPVRHAFSASMIGFAGNILLPARLGELIRVGVIAKHNRVGRSLALTALGITHLFDLLVLAAYFLGVSIWATRLFTGQRWTMALLGGGIVLLFASLAMVQRWSQALHTLLAPLRQKLPAALNRRLSRYAHLFLKGLGVLTQGRVVGRVVLLTIAVWSLETVAVYMTLEAFRVPPTPMMAAILVVVLNLSFAFPITPGNIGIAQALGVFLLGAFGIAQESALAYSIGMQGTTYLIIVSLGIVCFYYEKMNLNLVGQIARQGIAENQVPAAETS